MFIRCRLPDIPSRCVPDRQDPTTFLPLRRDHSAHWTSSNPDLSISAISQFATQVCAGPTPWKEHLGNDPAVMNELESQWCLELGFMHALGYEFSETQDVKPGKVIRVAKLGWCLRATIVMVRA